MDEIIKNVIFHKHLDEHFFLSIKKPFLTIYEQIGCIKGTS